MASRSDSPEPFNGVVPSLSAAEAKFLRDILGSTGPTTMDDFYEAPDKKRCSRSSHVVVPSPKRLCVSATVQAMGVTHDDFAATNHHVAADEPFDNDDDILPEILQLRNLQNELDTATQAYANASRRGDRNVMQFDEDSFKNLRQAIQETGNRILAKIQQEYWKYEPIVHVHKESSRRVDATKRWTDFRPFMAEAVPNYVNDNCSFGRAVEHLYYKWKGLCKRRTESNLFETVACDWVDMNTGGSSRTDSKKAASPGTDIVHPIHPWYILVKDHAGRKTFATFLFRLNCWDFRVDGGNASNPLELVKIVHRTRQDLKQIYPHVDENDLAKVLKFINKEKAKAVPSSEEKYGFGEDHERVATFVAVHDNELGALLQNPIKRLSPSRDWPFKDVLKFLRISVDSLKAEYGQTISAKTFEAFNDKISEAESCSKAFHQHHSVSQVLQGALLKDFAELNNTCTSVMSWPTLPPAHDSVNHPDYSENFFPTTP